MWNPFRSKIAAGVIGGIADIFMKPGSKVNCTRMCSRGGGHVHSVCLFSNCIDFHRYCTLELLLGQLYPMSAILWGLRCVCVCVVSMLALYFYCCNPYFDVVNPL